MAKWISLVLPIGLPPLDVESAVDAPPTAWLPPLDGCVVVEVPDQAETITKMTLTDAARCTVVG